MELKMPDNFKVYCIENYRSIIYYLFVTLSITLFTTHAILASIPYFNFEVYSEPSSEMLWPVELPEITICNNIIDGNPSTTLNSVSTLGEKDRVNGNPSDRIKCMFPDRQMDCEEYFKEAFNNLYYGTCKTLRTTKNAMDPKTAILMWNYGDAKFERDRNRGRASNIRNSIVVVVHEHGTEPILTPENVIRVGKVNQVQINVKQACLSSCFQNLTMKYCKCIIPYLYFSHNWGKLPVCYSCQSIPQDQLDQLCDCLPSCQESKYKVTVKEVVGVSSNLNFMDTILKKYNNSNPPPNVQTITDEFRQWSLSIKTETIDVEKSQENTLIDMTIFLSNFGGILGIWFGLSVMAIIEGITIFTRKYSVIALGYIKTIVNANEETFPRNVNTTDETFPRIENTDNIHIAPEEEDDYHKSSVSTYNIFRELKSKSNAFYWSVIFGIVFSLAITQTIVLISDYFQWKIMFKTDIVISQYEVFPSVTVCNGQSNSTEQSPAIEEFIKTCKHQYRENIKDCFVKNIVTFDNKRYGNCMTFNPGLIDKNDELRIDEMTMWLNCRANNTKASIQSQVGMGAILLIHPKGTAPVLRSQEIFTIQPGSFISLIYETTIYKRLKAPYETNCVDEYDEVYRKKIIYEEDDRKYIYTRDACVDGCFQNLTVTNKYCQDCYLAELLGRLKVSQGTKCISYCPYINAKDIDKTCGCRQPCRSVNHKVKIIQERPLNKFNYTLQVELKTNSLIIPAYDLRKRIFNFQYRDTSCGFTLRPNPFQYTVSEEAAKTEFLTLMSSIGGTFGLWIGLSFVSLIELSHTLIKDATAIVKSRNAHEH